MADNLAGFGCAGNDYVTELAVPTLIVAAIAMRTLLLKSLDQRNSRVSKLLLRCTSTISML